MNNTINEIANITAASSLCLSCCNADRWAAYQVSRCVEPLVKPSVPVSDAGKCATVGRRSLHLPAFQLDRLELEHSLFSIGPFFLLRIIIESLSDIHLHPDAALRCLFCRCRSGDTQH
jgi:hypothetical protein